MLGHVAKFYAKDRAAWRKWLMKNHAKEQSVWLVYDKKVHGQVQYALLYQLRMLSTSRFQRRLTTLDSKDFLKVKEKLEQLLGFS